MYTDWEYPVLPMVLSFEDYPPEISNRYPTKPFLKVEKHLQKRPPHLQGIYRFYSKNFGSVEFEKKTALRETTSDTFQGIFPYENQVLKRKKSTKNSLVVEPTNRKLK